MNEVTIILNGTPHTTRPKTTLRGLLEELDFAGKRIAVELNGEIVPKSEHHSTLLEQDDRLEIVVAVGGG